jgi:hypothetical protein
MTSWTRGNGARVDDRPVLGFQEEILGLIVEHDEELASFFDQVDDARRESIRVDRSDSSPSTIPANVLAWAAILPTGPFAYILESTPRLEVVKQPWDSLFATACGTRAAKGMGCGRPSQARSPRKIALVRETMRTAST